MSRVALISPYPEPGQPSTTGVAWYTQGLARALAGTGAEVTVVAPGPAGTDRVESDGPVRVQRCFSRGRAGLLRAARAATASGAQVTHVQHEAFLYGGPETVPALLVALGRLRGNERGPVVTMHQVVAPASVDRSFTGMHRVAIPPAVARAGLATMQKSISRLASRVIVHEDAFRRVVPGSVVMPLGANRPELLPASRKDQRTAELRARAGAPPGSLLVLGFGFVAPYKGLEPALEAARLAGERIRLVVAGTEHPRLVGQGYLHQLEERYRDVAYFTGYVDDGDVDAWFGASDAVLLNYPRPFSSSGVLAQAAHHGVPALLSAELAAVVGFPAESALPAEPDRMAKWLVELAGDPGRRDELRRRTGELGTGRSWPEVAERHLEIYEEVIDAQRASGRASRHRSRW